MNRSSKNILIMHDNNNQQDTPSKRGLGELVNALEGLGAKVKLRQCNQHCDEILDEIEKADTLFFWG